MADAPAVAGIGRRGAELVGRLLSEVSPSFADSTLARHFEQALKDRRQGLDETRAPPDRRPVAPDRERGADPGHH